MDIWPYISIILVSIIIALLVYIRHIRKQNTIASQIVRKGEILLLAFTLIVAGGTLYSSIDYSYNALDKFNIVSSETKNISESNENISRLNENISRLNQEIVDWYKHPEPLLINITNLDNYNAFIKRYDGLESVSQLMDEESEIRVKLRNCGWNDAKDLTLYLEFLITSYGQIAGTENPEIEHPYPVKIYSITTTPSSNNIMYNDTYKSSFLDGIGYICTDENGFIPTENCPVINLDIDLIEIDQSKTINLKLFAINSIQGDMILSIKDSNNVELQRIIIHLNTL